MLIALALAARAFDYIGGGAGSRSDGSMTEMSVPTEAANLNAVIDGLSARADIDASQIFLLGGSQVGFVSTYVAARRAERWLHIKCVTRRIGRRQGDRRTMDFNDLTKEQKEKARACKTADELVELANNEGIELTDEQLEGISGGWFTICSDQTCSDYDCRTMDYMHG